MIADDLVQLDEIHAAVAQPVGEALVQLGSGRLGQRLVGGVADQQVAEPEGVVAREEPAARPDELLADQPAKVSAHCRLVGRERLDSPPMEDLALDRPAFQRHPL